MVPRVVHSIDDAVSVRVEDVEIFRYVHRPQTPPYEGPKPYLHPVRTLDGDVVTGYRPHDHRWHKGGEHWLDERRELTVRDVEDDSWALEFATGLTNVRGDRERLETYLKRHPR
jgi:hypothetical protein